jgi:hypothetical protein
MLGDDPQSVGSTSDTSFGGVKVPVLLEFLTTMRCTGYPVRTKLVSNDRTPNMLPALFLPETLGFGGSLTWNVPWIDLGHTRPVGGL